MKPIALNRTYIARLSMAAIVLFVAVASAAGLPARHDDDRLRLDQARRAVIDAEQALRDNPAAMEQFGALLRSARLRLDDGLAAAAQTGIAGESPANLRAAPKPPAQISDTPRQHGRRDCDALATPARSGSSNGSLELHRRVRHARLIWV